MDQATKAVVLAHFAYGESMRVLPFLSWPYACHTGVAFSLFQCFGSVFGVVAALIAASGHRDMALESRLAGTHGAKVWRHSDIF